MATVSRAIWHSSSVEIPEDTYRTRRLSNFRKATRGPVVRRCIEHDAEPASLTEAGTEYPARWMIYNAESSLCHYRIALSGFESLSLTGKFKPVIFIP